MAKFPEIWLSTIVTAPKADTPPPLEPAWLFTMATSLSSTVPSADERMAPPDSLTPAALPPVIVVQYERLLATNGFIVKEHVVEDPQCGGHTVWLAIYQGDDQETR
jgi:hypothetical protein